MNDFGRATEEVYYSSKMKRLNNLFEKVISIDNLRLADERARKGKLHSYGVQLHDKNREAHILTLHEQLKNGTFKTSPYHVFTIYEPKERLIYRLPYFPDRILHHAIMNVLEPIWVSIFTKDTYSCIKNRGIHACAKSVRRALREDKDGTRYCLKIDVRKFYPSIRHDVLKAIIRRKIKDARLLALLDEIIDSVNRTTKQSSKPKRKRERPMGSRYLCMSKQSHKMSVDDAEEAVEEETVENESRGVPIGNYLSQFFANLVLAYFDHWLKEVMQVKYYWRYADDIVILSDSKEFLHNLLHEIRAYFATLELTVKKNYQVFPVESRGIDFLGYVFYHTHTRLRKSIKQRLCRRVAHLNKRKKQLPQVAYRQQICSWWGWCKYCNSINLFNKLKTTMPYEITFNRPKCALRHDARATQSS